jgi:bifunctional non-homologous end joining protein LigD
MIFDLDPGEGLGFDAVIAAAQEVRRVLAALGLTAFVKTTGGKGLHVVLPIARRHPWNEVKSFARAIAEILSVQAPDRYLAKMSRAARRGRIFIDYLRNDPTSTAVAPYSTRARPGAPVACPVSWRELRPGFDPAALNLATVPSRLRKQRSDPWAEIGMLDQRLPLQQPGLLSRAALTATKG